MPSPTKIIVYIKSMHMINKGILMNNKSIFGLGVIVSVGLLSGCGGGVIDESSSTISTAPASTATLPTGTAVSFPAATTKWSDVSGAGNTVTADGFSSEATLVYNSSTAAAPVIDTTAKVKINYDSSGNISGFNITNDHVNLTWVDGFTENNRTSSLDVTDGDEAQGMIYEPETNSSWDYQTMATWLETDEAAGTGRIGAASVGNHTANAAIPASGTATFSGVAEGMYVDDSHKFYRVSSNATLVANFASESVTFATSDSQTHNIDTGVISSNNDLNLTGTFNYSNNNNLITSNLSSTTSGWTGGTASAKFYGPNAEEVGGVFSIRGTGKEAYEGAFGAKQ
jgi:hypothetical protein